MKTGVNRLLYSLLQLLRPMHVQICPSLNIQPWVCTRYFWSVMTIGDARQTV